MSEGTLPGHEQYMKAGRDVDDSDPDSGNHHEDIVDSESAYGVPNDLLSFDVLVLEASTDKPRGNQC